MRGIIQEVKKNITTEIKKDRKENLLFAHFFYFSLSGLSVFFGEFPFQPVLALKTSPYPVSFMIERVS